MSFEKLCQEEKYLMIGIDMTVICHMVVINDRNFENFFLHGTNCNGTLSTVRFSPFPINVIREK